MNLNNIQKKSGFSAVELLVTLSIATILAMVATPSFLNLIENSRLDSNKLDITTALSTARLTAINRSVTVSICSSIDSSTCRADGGKNDWSDGWIVFVDINGDGVVDSPDCSDLTKDCILKVWGALAEADVMTGTNNVVVYNAEGSLTGLAQNMVLSPKALIDCGADQKMTIAIGVSGKTTITTADCS